MSSLLANVLLLAAAAGFVLLVIQIAALFWHLRSEPLPAPDRPPGISILKPLCGVDDDLAGHLDEFANLNYPSFELLLGVKNTQDAAYPLATRFAARYPDRVRVLLQDGEPGQNPKVNQLITLAGAARHPIVVVSDSNVRVAPDYLDEIAAHLRDPDVGLVTHLIAGAGAQTLGAHMDNLQLSGSVAPGVAGAHRVAKKGIVLGKSMALRQDDLRALGGFGAVKDILAEDWALARAVRLVLGKRIVVASRPIWNVARDHSIADFVSRWRRWSVLHRKAVGLVVYMGELLLNPVFLAMTAFAISPSRLTLFACAALCAVRCALDLLSQRLLGTPRLPFRRLWISPARDLLVGVAWVAGLLRDTVVWRGNVRRVLPGTRLLPESGPTGGDLEPFAEDSAEESGLMLDVP